MTSVSLYVMHDRLSKVYGEVFEHPNDEAVRRTFKRVIQSNLALGMPVEDIVVFRLGVVEKDGIIPRLIPDSVPTVVMRGDEDEFIRAHKAALSASVGSTVRETIQSTDETLPSD